MKKTFFLLTAFIGHFTLSAQTNYDVSKAHSHNDYEQKQAFYQAFAAGFGSMEADVYWAKNTLCVAHEPNEIKPERSFKALYLEPILREVAINGSIRPFQLLIDLKTEGIPTLTELQKLLLPYKSYFDRKHNPNAIQLVISGERPAPSTWGQFDEIFYFDGRLDEKIPADLQERMPLISDSFRKFSLWNGLGKLPTHEYKKVDAFVQAVHAQGKKVRFWATPDNRTVYAHLIKLQVDWLGTDKIDQLASYLNQLPQNTASFQNPSYQSYAPTYKTDGIQQQSKNVILLIGDGMGLAQMYAGFTANHAQLNVFKMKYIGLSKTNSADNFHTDSAAGATAMGTGTKTKNRYLGVDSLGNNLVNMTETLAQKQIKTGLVVVENITGATPSGFYAHQPERNWEGEILKDLLASPVNLAIGAGQRLLSDDMKKNNPNIEFLTNIAELPSTKKAVKTLVLVNDNEVRAKSKGRGSFLAEAFDKAVEQLSKDNPKGFFLMVEGSQIDNGGHANNLDYIAEEMVDFDHVIGKAMAFADKNGETTVLVTADHETGGLTLHGGDFKTGQLEGAFASPDHTGIPVMVFAYGLNASLFQGFYENTDIYHKIIRCLGQ